MSVIFISHSSRDGEEAQKLKDWLDTQGFQQIFLDFDKHAGLQPGSDWERSLYTNLERSEAVIIVLTPNWLDSKWCFAEYTQARALGKAIFPIIYTPIGDQVFAPEIQRLDLMADREGGLQRLAAQLQRIVLDAQGGFTWDKSRPPYPGLLSYEEEDAAIYFGRDDDIRRVVERMNARRVNGGRKLIAMLGGSGSGKSSLLRAGVLPRLKRDTRNWIVLPPMRPQTHPISELATCMAVALGEKERWRELAEKFAQPNAAALLRELARDLRTKRECPNAQILLAIDQGEELFTMAAPEEAQRFLSLLSVALAPDMPYLALATLRSEFLSQIQLSRHLTVPFEEYSMKPMPVARIAEIIEGPARVAGITVEKQMVMQVVQDATSADALPLLAFTLRELYDQFGSDGELSYADYTALGDAEYRAALDGKTGLNPFENSIRRKADEVMREVVPSEAELAGLRDAFSPFLVRVNDVGEYTRRLANFDQLPTASHRLIEALIKARLLVSHDTMEARTVEVVHDALLRKWPLLKTWLDTEREFLLGVQRLQGDIEDYQAAAPEGKVDTLLTGSKLELARGWLQERPHKLSGSQSTYIQSSVDHADKLKREDAERLKREQAQVARTRIFQRRFATALGGLAVVVALVSLGSVLLARSAAERESQLFAAKAYQAFEEGNCDQALRFAVAGLPQGSSLSFAVWSKEASHELRKAALSCRLQSMLAGHTADLRHIAFSPNGQRVVTSSADNTAIVWDHAAARQLLKLEGHTSVVYHGGFDPSQRLIATASSDYTARIWDATTGKQRHVLKHANTVWTVWFDATGKRVLTASDDNTAALWDADTGQLLHKLAGHTDIVTFAIFDPTSTLVATGSGDKTAKIWDAASGKEKFKLEGHEAGVRAGAFTRDGRLFVTVSDDRTGRIWDTATGQLLRKLLGHTGEVLKVALDPFGPYIATASTDSTIRIWNLDTGALVSVLAGHTGEVKDVAFLAGRRLVSVGVDATTRIWDAANGTQEALLRGHHASIETIAVTGGGGMFATASDDKTARVWDGNVKSDGRLFGKKTSPSAALAIDGQGLRAVTGHDDGNARVWMLDDGRLGMVIDAHKGNVTAVAFSSDGTLIATAGEDSLAKVWDASSGKVLAELKGHTAIVRFVQFTADGRQLLTTSEDKTGIVWDLASKTPRFTLKGHTSEVYSADISSEQTAVVTASTDNTARIWNLATGRELHVLKGHEAPVWKARFNHDGTQVVTISDDKTARIWDVGTGKILHVLKGHRDALGNGQFSPDGKRVLTSSDDGTARIWDAATGRLVNTLSGHTSNVLVAQFSSDGKRALTTSRDHTARIWDTADGGMLLLLRGHAGSVDVGGFRNKDGFVVTTSQDATVRQWNVALPALVSTRDQRIKVCTQMIEGARDFTSSELNDAVVGAASGGKSACARTGSLGLSKLMNSILP